MPIFTRTENVWDDFFRYISQYSDKCCIVKNLSQDDSKEILVANICQPFILNQYVQFFRPEQMTDILYLDNTSRLFFAIIPKKSKTFINLFCCNMTMENVHSKFANYGLALEGCFNIEPITNMPSFYQGYDYSTDANKIMSALVKNNVLDMDILNISYPIVPNEQAFLIIDDHKYINIIDSKDLKTYEPKGVNVQYIEGKRLFNDGKPFVDIEQIKNVKIMDNGSERIVHGSKVTINYDNHQIKIDKEYYDFMDIGKKINFINSEFFSMDNSLLVIAIDKNENLIIVYHKHIDIYNMLLLLKLFNSYNAILLCNSPNANIIWKEKGFNMYNKTDFIGNPNKKLSNIITFSG